MISFTPTDTPAFDLSPVNLTAALDEAHKNRPELHRLDLQKDINQIDLQYYQNQTRPQVDLTGTVAATGLAGTACDPVTNTCVLCATDVVVDRKPLFGFANKHCRSMQIMHRHGL